MACACGSAKNRQRYEVKLPGGLRIVKNSEDEAKKFAAKHPGSTFTKL
jgi:hypothetical protein